MPGATPRTSPPRPPPPPVPKKVTIPPLAAPKKVTIPPIAPRARGSTASFPITPAVDNALAGALETLATAFAEPRPARKMTMPPPIPSKAAAKLARTPPAGVVSPPPVPERQQDDGEFVGEAPTTIYSRMSVVAPLPKPEAAVELSMDIWPSRTPFWLGTLFVAAACIGLFLLLRF